MDAPLVYAIGLEPLLARALYADLGGATICRRRPLRRGRRRGRNGPPPDLVLVDLDVAELEAELAAARAAWGQNTPIVGVGRCSPFACVWQRHDLAKLVEIGPGFLPSLLA